LSCVIICSCLSCSFLRFSCSHPPPTPWPGCSTLVPGDGQVALHGCSGVSWVDVVYNHASRPDGRDLPRQLQRSNTTYMMSSMQVVVRRPVVAGC
jgi:hypothetical protein